MTKLNKNLKLYEVHCPIEEIWVVEVMAENPEDAWNKRNEGIQTHSYAGTEKKIVELKREIEPGDGA